MQFNRERYEDEKDARRVEQSENPIRKSKRSVETVLETVLENLSSEERWENPTVVEDFSKRNLAEREGFEPPVGISYARFPGVCLKPLSHLSASKAGNHARGGGSIAMDFHTLPTKHFAELFLRVRTSGAARVDEKRAKSLTTHFE